MKTLMILNDYNLPTLAGGLSKAILLPSLAGVGVIVIGISAFLVNKFVIVRNRQRRMAKDLEKKYTRIHELLTCEVEKEIERLYNISQQNDEYLHYFDEYTADYQKILEDFDKASYVAISTLSQTISDNKFNGLASLIDATKTTVNDFGRKVENIYDDLNTLLQKDDEFHQKEVNLQRKYRDIKAKYSQHESELSLMQSTFETLFFKIEQIFTECEELTNCAKYDESAEKLPQIASVINELDKYFDSLPEYCIRTTKIIPQKIQEIKNLYDKYEAKDFPLHHLKINTRIDIYNSTLDQIANNLKQFKLSGIGKSLDEIDAEILSVQKALAYEEECKQFYDQNYETIYKSSYDVEKKFMKIKRQLPEYKRYYLLSEKYLLKVEELQKDIDDVALLKRDLDTYIHSQMRQPFSIVCQKVKDMQNEKVRIDQIIDDFQNYLGSLKLDTEIAYQKICDYYKRLKEAQFMVREVSVISFSKILRPRFNQAYDYLEEIGKIVTATPINIAKANEILFVADEFITVLLNDVNVGLGQRKYAEDSLVYINQYLQDFDEVSAVVSSASIQFFDGDFTASINDTASMIKKIRPDQGEITR